MIHDPWKVDAALPYKEKSDITRYKMLSKRQWEKFLELSEQKGGSTYTKVNKAFQNCMDAYEDAESAPSVDEAVRKLEFAAKLESDWNLTEYGQRTVDRLQE